MTYWQINETSLYLFLPSHKSFNLLSKDQTEVQLLNPTYHDTAIFGLTYARGSAGRALFAVAIDLLSLFDNLPPCVAGPGEKTRTMDL